MDTGCTIGKPFIRLFGIPTTEMIGNSLRFKGERGEREKGELTPKGWEGVLEKSSFRGEGMEF